MHTVQRGVLTAAHLELATVKLQQPPVWEEELAAYNGSSEACRALNPLTLCTLCLPGSLQHHSLVGVGAPGGGGWGPGLGYNKHELLHDVFQGLCTLSSCFDSCSNAIAEVHVLTGLGCNEMDMCNRVCDCHDLQVTGRSSHFCVAEQLWLHRRRSFISINRINFPVGLRRPCVACAYAYRSNPKLRCAQICTVQKRSCKSDQTACCPADWVIGPAYYHEIEQLGGWSSLTP